MHGRIIPCNDERNNELNKPTTACPSGHIVYIMLCPREAGWESTREVPAGVDGARARWAEGAAAAVQARHWRRHLRRQSHRNVSAPVITFSRFLATLLHYSCVRFFLLISHSVHLPTTRRKYLLYFAIDPTVDRQQLFGIKSFRLEIQVTVQHELWGTGIPCTRCVSHTGYLTHGDDNNSERVVRNLEERWARRGSLKQGLTRAKEGRESFYHR